MASSATTQGCTTAIIGAGAGGLYTAYRMVVDALVPASSICIFEASGRIGGRILSVRNLGPLGDMVLDAGGYRTFDSISPRTQYLIETRLGLKVCEWVSGWVVGEWVGEWMNRIGRIRHSSLAHKTPTSTLALTLTRTLTVFCHLSRSTVGLL